MLPVIEKLLVLQDRDRRRLRLQAELGSIEPQRQRLKARSAQSQSSLDALKQRAKHLESERRRLELEAASKQQFIEKCRTQQGQTRKNDEYQAFQHQIDTTHSEIHALEDLE